MFSEMTHEECNRVLARDTKMSVVEHDTFLVSLKSQRGDARHSALLCLHEQNAVAKMSSSADIDAWLVGRVDEMSHEAYDDYGYGDLITLFNTFCMALQGAGSAFGAHSDDFKKKVKAAIVPDTEINTREEYDVQRRRLFDVIRTAIRVVVRT